MTGEYHLIEGKDRTSSAPDTFSYPVESPTGRNSWLLKALDRTSHFAFAGLILLGLITPSWRYGPFAWLPLWHFPELAGGPVDFGLLNFLPLVLLVSWLTGRYLRQRWQAESSQVWRWGSCRLTIPLLALTLIGLLSLVPAIDRRTFIQAGGLAIFWLLYLYVINQRPKVVPILLLVGVVQGSVAVLQFWQQANIGLDLLGELPLNPIHEGVSVLWARGIPWLRAYGLTAHPNLLGAILTTVLLFALPALVRARGRQQLLLSLAMALSLLGLLLSFSRSALVGLLAGTVTWFVMGRVGSHHPNERRIWLLAIPFLILLFLLTFGYGDLFISRVIHLDTPGEAQSLNQRIDDGRLALQIVGQHPLLGVGLGNYTDFAQTIKPAAARVHNVPILVTAELGLFGGLLILWLGVSPLIYWFRRRRESQPLSEGMRDSMALWVAMLVIGLFDTTLWLAGNWQTAILFSLICSKMVASWEGC